MRRQSFFAGCVGLVLITGAPGYAQVRAGDLHCSTAGGFGYIVGSSRGVTCTYNRADGTTDFYQGSAGRIGLDLGPADALDVTYIVLAPPHLPPGALAGSFAGLGAGATVVTGVGLQALVGGPGGAIKLIPSNNEAVTGLNVNAGIATMQLGYVGSEHRPRYVDPIYR